ncbi:MAG: hypothetical protein ACJ740_12500 [Gaiellales bacterium]|jgi:uncharacterized membrane protein|nr:hypothetical protein [Gaiellales bacterium]
MKKMLLVRALTLVACIAVGLGITLVAGNLDQSTAVLLGTGVGLALFAVTLILEATVKLPQLPHRK